MSLASVYLVIRSSLLLHVLLNHLFITVLPHGVRVIAACPKLSAPEHFLHLRVGPEYLPRGDAFDDLHNGLR